MAGEKRRRVVFRLLRFARQIKRHVFVGAERSSHEARFAGLSCPGEHYHGALRRPAAEETFDKTREPTSCKFYDAVAEFARQGR